VPKIKQSFIWKFFIKCTDGGNAICNICNREVKSDGKGGGTTNLINHLKRNHAANEDVKLALGKIENDNKKVLKQANNLINQYLTILICIS